MTAAFSAFVAERAIPLGSPPGPVLDRRGGVLSRPARTFAGQATDHAEHFR